MEKKKKKTIPVSVVIPVLCCVLFAIITWIYVMAATDPVETHTCAVSYYSGLPVEIDENTATFDITVKVKAPRSVIVKCLRDGISVRITGEGTEENGVWHFDSSSLTVVPPENLGDATLTFEISDLTVRTNENK